MTEFTLHDVESAPEESRERLAAAKKALGFIPNLWAIQAEAPTLLEGYQTLSGIFDRSSLSPTERQIVLITVSFENDCTYCVAAHTGLAKIDNVPDDVVESLRRGTPISDPKLEALHEFARAIVRGRGWVDPEETQKFLNAGYQRQQLLEVILGIAVKTMSNYTNHFADTPLDQAFGAFEWKKPEQSRAA